MVLGLLGIGYGFLTAPKTIQDVEKILAAEESHGGGHGQAMGHEATGHATATDAGTHTPEGDKVTGHEAGYKTETPVDHVEPVVAKQADSLHKDTIAIVGKDTVLTGVVAADTHEEAAPAEHKKAEAHDAHAEHQAHLEHVLHQLQNKPWAAFYVACIFFMLISLGVLAFYGINVAASAGWSPILFRVMQGITAYLPVASVIFIVFLVMSIMHMNHLFPWLAEGVTDPKSPNYDHMIAGKSGYLNPVFWIIRAVIFLGGWNLYRYFSRRNCLAQDESTDDSNYKRNFKLSAGFLVFFIVTESLMSWDWIMSVDPHWFSTLFAWYVFASFIVSAVTVICMVTLYMKSRGYLEYVNSSHIHDLAKFMFGFSVFWTYLWFSQFMLIWYANIPEEVTYFVQRINDFTLPFWLALVMNFVFPILILVNTDFKRVSWILVTAAICILGGHYLDFFNMIMPATVGTQWFIGVPEIGAVCFFLGLFIMVVFTAMTKAPLVPKRSPFIEESKHFHY
jgi:hypothetical protein